MRKGNSEQEQRMDKSSYQNPSLQMTTDPLEKNCLHGQLVTLLELSHPTRSFLEASGCS